MLQIAYLYVYTQTIIKLIVMDKICVNSAKCPIFSGVLLGKEMTSKSYKSRYCEAGSQGWETCKRYMAKAKFGVCPSDLLPNSILSLDEIAVKYKLKAV